MKINQKILSIPPHISTSWKNVLSMHIETKSGGTILVIELLNGSLIKIPDLSPPTVDSIFAAHQRYLEQEGEFSSSSHPPITPEGLPADLFLDQAKIVSLPFRFSLDSGMQTLLEHNGEGANQPPIAEEILKKIGSLFKMIDTSGHDNFPKAEPHCNCFHCQISRTIRAERDNEEPSLPVQNETPISDEDLSFREWDIKQLAEELYQVSNPFIKEECYSVFLGTPVGCTCGKSHCEHLRAVLSS